MNKLTLIWFVLAATVTLVAAQRPWDAGDFIAFFFLFIVVLLGICAGLGYYARKRGGYSTDI